MDFSSGRSPSSSLRTMASSSAVADSKSLMVGSMLFSLAYFAADLSFVEGHAHAVAGRNRRSLADDHRAVFVPAYGVSAGEDRERAEIVQAAGEDPEPRVGAVAVADGRGVQPAERPVD